MICTSCGHTSHKDIFSNSSPVLFVVNINFPTCFQTIFEYVKYCRKIFSHSYFDTHLKKCLKVMELDFRISGTERSRSSTCQVFLLFSKLCFMSFRVLMRYVMKIKSFLRPKWRRFLVSKRLHSGTIEQR